ncbi:MAG: DUF4832 domain-containing protein [Kiritimatiellia bacterium]
MITSRPTPHQAVRWVDLSAIRDDKTVLRNPHKGWYWHYIDNGMARINYRSPAIHTKGDYVEDFPGLSHLYLRIDWSDIEAERDVYDWSYIDAIMEEWGARGYRFSFRVCNYEGGPDIPYATPKWLRDMGCGGTDVTFEGAAKTAWEPDYGDPLFLDRLECFVRHYAAKFDGHPLVEYVDLGSYGTWGEGHCWRGTMKNAPVEVLKRHMDIHARYFLKTPVLLNDDVVSVRPGDTDENRWALLNYAREKGFGLRDDSVCVEGVARDFGYDSLRGPWLFDYFRDQAPVDIEYEHYHMIKPEVMKDGLPFLAALERAGATYAGFHGYPRKWLEGHRYFTEHVANRLGYWYFIEGLDMPAAAVSNVRFCMDLFWRNAGFARAYRRFGLTLRLAHDTSGAAWEQELADIDNRRWQPGETVRERVKVDLPKLPAGVYRVSLAMYEACGSARTPIRLAVKDSCVDAQGFARLTKIEVT